MKRVAILGSGGMGTAMAALFARSARSVQVWARNPAIAAEIAGSHENSRHLPGVSLPSNVGATTNACDATSGADLIVAAIPSAHLRATLVDLAERIPVRVPILSVVKGIEDATFARPTQIIRQCLGARPVAILSGPSHAEELGRGLPASVVVAGDDDGLCVRVRDALSHGMFRVYTSTDPLGIEIAGALKNIIGIAAGICDGLGFGDNAKAALLTRGLVEMRRYGLFHGALESTFYGLAGFGDIVTTCYSPYGRNRMVGERIGRGESLEQILATMVNVAEGVPTTHSVRAEAIRNGIEMPITESLYQILFEDKRPLEAVTDLMLRAPKVESQP